MTVSWNCKINFKSCASSVVKGERHRGPLPSPLAHAIEKSMDIVINISQLYALLLISNLHILEELQLLKSVIISVKTNKSESKISEQSFISFMIDIQFNHSSFNISLANQILFYCARFHILRNKQGSIII